MKRGFCIHAVSWGWGTQGLLPLQMTKIPANLDQCGCITHIFPSALSQSRANRSQVSTVRLTHQALIASVSQNFWSDSSLKATQS